MLGSNFKSYIFFILGKKINFLFCCNMENVNFFLCFCAILTTLLVNSKAQSSFLQFGCELTSPSLIYFFLLFKIFSSSEWTEIILLLFEITFSISFSLLTNKVPVDEPAKVLPHNNRLKSLLEIVLSCCQGWPQNKKHSYKTSYFQQI